MLLKQRHLRDFVAIADSRSLHGAAKVLGLSQPALSRSLRELEATLGAVLVERTARGVVLTAAGERFLLRARAAVESVRLGVEEVQQLQSQGGAGAVTVALSSAPILGLLPAGFGPFRRAWPAVRLHLIEGLFPQIEARLRDGRIDFYLGPRPEGLQGNEFQVEQVAGNRRFVMARTGHPLAGATSLAELLNAHWLTGGLRERFEEEFEELFARRGLASPASRTRVESMLALATLLVSTDAVTVLPQQWARSALFADRIRPLPIREALDAPDVVLVTASRFPLTPAAEAFAQALRHAAGAA